MIFVGIDSGHIKPQMTHTYLRRQYTWMDWAMSEFKQLNQYHAQGMFGEPTERPVRSNVHPFI